MRRRHALMAGAAALLLLAAASCKGRTMENMQPDGETVDVVIDTVAIDSTL